MAEQLSFTAKPRMVRHARSEQAATPDELRYQIDERFFLLAKHAHDCQMCGPQVRASEYGGPEFPAESFRMIHWCTEYRRIHAEIWHLIGASK